jgi:hypothetical protein
MVICFADYDRLMDRIGMWNVKMLGACSKFSSCFAGYSFLWPITCWCNNSQYYNTEKEGLIIIFIDFNEVRFRGIIKIYFL